MKRLAIGLTILIILLLGGVVVAPGFIDWNKYKDQIITRLHDASGYDFEIAGSLEFAVLPFPHLLIEDLTVSNPDVTVNKPMLKLKRADISVALLPLLSGEVEVNSVRFIEPDLNLVVLADGCQSWLTNKIKETLEQGTGKEETKGGLTNLISSVSLKEIEIEKGSFRYSDLIKQKTVFLEHMNLNLEGETLLGPYEVDGSVNFQKQQIVLALTTGKISSLKDSIAIQASMNAPALETSIQYSGIVDMQDGLELQGETTLNSKQLAAFVNSFTGKQIDILAHNVFVKGVLSYAPEEMAYRNLSVVFADTNATGSLVAKGLAENQMPVVELQLDMDTLALDKIIGQGKIKANSQSKGKALFAETFSLPRDINVETKLSIKSISYKGQTFNAFSGRVKKDEKDISVTFKTQLPGNGKGAFDGVFKYKSVSGGKDSKGTVIFSDPVVTYKTSLDTPNMKALVGLFMPPESMGGLEKVLNEDVALTAQGTITPDKLGFSETSLSLGKDSFGLSGSYKKGGEGYKDILTLRGGAKGIDLDRWRQKFAPREGQVKSKSLEETLASLKLPMDFDLSISLKDSLLFSKTFQDLFFTLKTAGKRIQIEEAGLKDVKGDTIALSGTVGDYSALKDVDLSISGKTGDIKNLAQTFGMDVKTWPEIGTVEISSEFKGQGQVLDYIANAKALRGSLQVSGRLANYMKTPQINAMSLRLRHPNYVELVRLFQPKFNSAIAIKKDLDFFSSMKREGSVYKFSEIKALVGPTTISGMLDSDMSGTRPSLKGELLMGELPIDAILGHEVGRKGTSRAARSQQTQQEIRWSRNAINTASMHVLDLDLHLAAKQVSYGGWVINNADTQITMKAGQLDVSPLKGHIYGGTALIKAQVKSSANPREPLFVKGNTQFNSVSLEEFIQAFSGSRLVDAKGMISVNTDFEATGLSPAALVFDLHGKGKADGKDLVFEGFDLARLSRSLTGMGSSVKDNFGSILGAATSGGTTKFDTLESAYTIKEGVIYFDTLKLMGPEASINGMGNVNLPLWTLDLTTDIKLVEPADAPVLRASFKGPLDNPARAFGQGALDAYFQKQINKLLQDTLMKKLEKKGVIAPQQTAPAPAEGTEVQPVQEQQPAQQQQQPREVKPEDVFMGILQGVLEGQ